LSRESEDSKQSVVHGIPLAAEIGLGALTLPGFVREVTARFADREALVQQDPDIRWSYRELWDRSIEVARALVAAGLGKGERVGVLMTNRPEFLATVFGTTLAGGVATPLSTFSTPHELDHLLAASACSFLLFERHVLKKDFAQILCDLEPAITGAVPGRIVSLRFPFLQHLVVTDNNTTMGAVETWASFLKRGAQTRVAQVEARAESVKPSDLGALFSPQARPTCPRAFSAHIAASPSNFGACDISRG
jgi:fatty-acyl-CoA synthase